MSDTAEKIAAVKARYAQQRYELTHNTIAAKAKVRMSGVGSLAQVDSYAQADYDASVRAEAEEIQAIQRNAQGETK